MKGVYHPSSFTVGPMLSLLLIPAFISLILLHSCQRVCVPSTDLTERYLRARALYLKGETAEAGILFEQIFMENPEYEENSRDYVRCLLYAGDPEKALDTACSLPDEGLKRNIDLIRLSAEAALLLKRYDEAEILINAGLKSSSEDTGLLVLLARCCRAQGRLDEALAILETARLLTERDVEIFTVSAQIYASCGMEEQAARVLESGIVRLPFGHPLKAALKERLEDLSGRIGEETSSSPER